MLKERNTLIRRGVILLDMITVVAAFFISYFIRLNFHIFYRFDLIPSEKVVAGPVPLSEYLPVLFLWVGICTFLLYMNGLYRSVRVRPFIETSWVIFKSVFLAMLAFSSIGFIFKIHFVSRVFFLIFAIASCLLLVLQKWLFIVAMRTMRRSGYNYRCLLIVGTGPRAVKFIEVIKKHPEWGYNIKGLIDNEMDKVDTLVDGIKVIGLLSDLPDILKHRIVDEVIFVVPRKWLDSIQDSIAACETLGIKAHVAADLPGSYAQ